MKTEEPEAPTNATPTNVPAISQRKYIIFVGNLPYEATKETIRAHFKTAEPIKSVRLLTDKQTKKPKGFAFVEFENADAFQRGLTFHHSLLNNRKINVEMTAGGGGSKSEARKQKLVKKNEELRKQREQMHKVRANDKDSSSGASGGRVKVPPAQTQQTAKKKRATGANSIEVPQR